MTDSGTPNAGQKVDLFLAMLGGDAVERVRLAFMPVRERFPELADEEFKGQILDPLLAQLLAEFQQGRNALLLKM